MATKKDAPKKKTKLDKFHYHEALDRTDLVSRFFEEAVATHAAVYKNPKYEKHVKQVQEGLGKLYQAIGQDY